MTTDMRTAPSSGDHQPQTLGFMPWMPAPVRARRVDASVPTAPPTEQVTELPLSMDKIDSADGFEAISIPAGDLISNGRVAKFLIDRRDPTRPVVRFVNGNFTEGGVVPESARFHYMFALAVLNIGESLEEFNAVTYFTNDKRYVAGVVHSYFPRWVDRTAVRPAVLSAGRDQRGRALEAVRLVRDKITKSLDLEVKLLESGQWVVKQVREFGGS